MHGNPNHPIRQLMPPQYFLSGDGGVKSAFSGILRCGAWGCGDVGAWGRGGRGGVGREA
jgi:hypothetical protein